MNATITGDIVHSQSVKDPSVWLDPLKKLFKTLGESPSVWEIYRGDSFQLHVSAEESLRIALLIKSVIRKQKINSLDVRLAIGISNQKQNVSKVSEATGDAFVYSGQLLDELKEKKVHLGLRSSWEDLDKEFAMIFKLASVILDSWTANTAEVAELLFSISGITQVEIAQRLDLAQSTVNDRIKRGSVYTIMEMEQYFREKLNAVNSYH